MCCRELAAVGSFHLIEGNRFIGIDQVRSTADGDLALLAPPFTGVWHRESGNLGRLLLKVRVAIIRKEGNVVQLGIPAADLDPNDAAVDHRRWPELPPYQSVEVSW